jgi:hypothetical protein
MFNPKVGRKQGRRKRIGNKRSNKKMWMAESNTNTLVIILK